MHFVRKPVFSQIIDCFRSNRLKNQPVWHGKGNHSACKIAGISEQKTCYRHTYSRSITIVLLISSAGLKAASLIQSDLYFRDLYGCYLLFPCWFWIICLNKLPETACLCSCWQAGKVYFLTNIWSYLKENKYTKAKLDVLKTQCLFILIILVVW